MGSGMLANRSRLASHPVLIHSVHDERERGDALAELLFNNLDCSVSCLFWGPTVVISTLFARCRLWRSGDADLSCRWVLFRIAYCDSEVVR